MSAAEFSNPHILRTKLYRPPARPELETRARLLARLNRSLGRPLTLIAAPAGYGKTVLASQWLETCDYPSAWLSLDESDNDLGVFLSYLLAATSNAFPDLNFRTLNLMAVPNLPSIPLLAQILITDLDQISEPFIIVLDNVHHLHHPEISDLFDLLLKHPPRNLHLVLIGRHDPAFEIVTLRARSQITEIRTRDLRFTPQESIQLMQNMLGRAVDPAVAADWTQKTEGWVTALRLAVLSLHHRGQADDLSVPVRGDSRYLRDYLVAEILAHISPPYQDCLVRLALLDRFCAPLCETMCCTDSGEDMDGITGETFLDWLECENLFLIPLDDQHQWFRFHHLFQELLLDLLQAKLNTEEINFLRMRASNWFHENGLLDEAIQYALDANDAFAASHLVEQHRYELMNSEQWRRLDIWLRRLPKDIVVQSPQLCCTVGFLYLQKGRDNDWQAYLKFAEQLLSHLEPQAVDYRVVESEITVLRAVLDLPVTPTQAFARAERALKQLPQQALHIRAIALLIKMLCLQMQGNTGLAVETIKEAFAEQSWPEAIQTRFNHYICIMYLLEGNLNGILNAARAGLRMAEKLRLPEILSCFRYDLGYAHYLKNEFTQAEPYLLASLDDRYLSVPNYLANSGFVLALMYLSQDRKTEAIRIMNLLEATFWETNASSALASTLYFRVELAIQQGNLTEAHHLSQSVDFELGLSTWWFFYMPQLTPIKLLLALGTPQSLNEARDQLNALHKSMSEVNRKNALIEVLALQALVYAAQGDQSAADQKLFAALELGFIGGNIRSFVDLGAPMAKLLQQMQAHKTGEDQTAYIEQILGAFPSEQFPQHMPVQVPLDEPLTNRELEVLALLAQRLSNKEIAAELVISPRTVKRHTLNIYKKLAVNSRQQAVEKASELGIFA